MPVSVLPLAFLGGCLGLQQIGGTADSGSGGAGDTGPTFSSFGGMTFPQTVDFGQIDVGTAETVDVVLVNESASNVTITELALEAPAAFDAEYTSVPWVIGSGGEYVITLTFFPTVEGVQDGTLSFGVDGVDGLADIAISGEGWVQGSDSGSSDGGAGDGGSGDGGSTSGLDFSDTSLTFPTTAVGSTNSQSVVIVNDTGDGVMISSITSSSAAFTTTGITTPTEMGDATSKTLQVRFAPTEARAYSETITVVSELGSTSIAVSGTGQAGASLGPILSVDTGGGSSSSMEFFSALGIPDTQSVRLSNVGDEDLIVRDVYVDNDTLFGTFQIVGWSGSETLGEGDSTTFSVKYTCPDLLCLDIPNPITGENVLHIESNDPSNPDWEIDLNGA